MVCVVRRKKSSLNPATPALYLESSSWMLYYAFAQSFCCKVAYCQVVHLQHIVSICDDYHKHLCQTCVY